MKFPTTAFACSSWNNGGSMKKFDSERYAALFQRDRSIQRVGGILTVIPMLLLVVAVFLAQTGTEGEGIFEGNHLIAFIIIVGVALFEIGFWIYFLVVHGKVQRVLLGRETEYLTEKAELPFQWKENTVLVFSHRNAKSFNVIREGNKSEVLKMNFEEFFSLYDGDVTFYICFAKSLSCYVKERELPVKTLLLKADYPGKRGVKEILLVQDGVLTKKAEKWAKKYAL